MPEKGDMITLNYWINQNDFNKFVYNQAMEAARSINVLNKLISLGADNYDGAAVGAIMNSNMELMNKSLLEKGWTMKEILGRGEESKVIEI